jgi:23S rRNA (adenine2503-C2)-methyltransferase
MFEYLLLAGINDSPKQSKELATLLKDNFETKDFVVNLINYNQTGVFKPSPRLNRQKFKKILQQNQINTVERHRFGNDIKAACGQLSKNTSQ